MGSMMRMRFMPREADLPLEQTELYRTTIGQVVTEWMPRPPEYSLRVVAGDPDRSAAIYRMERRSGNGFMMDQMPPIATERRDEEGIALVRAWIAGLPHDAPSFVPMDASSPMPLQDPVVPAMMDAGVAPLSEDASAQDAIALEDEAGNDAEVAAQAVAQDADAMASDATPGLDAGLVLDGDAVQQLDAGDTAP
jgi:hypothetical protein